jgi:choline dehydrogenase
MSASPRSSHHTEQAAAPAETFDFIIVGAGSAGCVLASRLSEDPRNRVLLLEYGGSDRSMFIRMPSALHIPMNRARFNWGDISEPEPHLGNRRIKTPRGKVLGGSSSINGMVYIRGHPLDFDGWEKQGARGWGWRDVLPYFRRAETREEGPDEYRGGDGPLHTSYGRLANPLDRAFLKAAAEAGYARTEDVNGYRQEGFGRFDMTVRRGRRWSAASAYLDPAMGRPNLVVRTHALATRILFEGRRAIGVAWRRGGVEHVAQAGREIIVAAGAINTPQLLKLSGIGPAAELRDAGIPVVRDAPGVGENLQDHLEVYVQVAARQPVSLYSATGLLAKAAVGARWLLRGDGIGASNHFEVGGFVRSRAGIAYPDIQFHFLPLAVSYDGSGLARCHGFQIHAGPMRSKSRGWVRLAGPDPAARPRIRFNYMSHPDDWMEMRAAIRLAREILAQPAFDRYRGRELAPGAEAVSDAAIDEFIRDRAETAYHPSCSCRMGPADDQMAVVDPEARVIGVERLRVADASIMPSITNGNLNAPTIMIGEKVSDMVLGRPPLPASNAPFYRAPDWRTAQR